MCAQKHFNVTWFGIGHVAGKGDAGVCVGAYSFVVVCAHVCMYMVVDAPRLFVGDHLNSSRQPPGNLMAEHFPTPHPS